MTFDYKDYGKEKYIVNIDDYTKENENYRTTIWTGEKLQVTLMSIQPGDDIGLEVHKGIDQFLRIEEGKGLCQMGDAKDNLSFEQEVTDDDVILVPANTWHNVTNTGDQPLKIYSIYAGPDHLQGTIHKTHQDAKNDPNEH